MAASLRGREETLEELTLILGDSDVFCCTCSLDWKQWSFRKTGTSVGVLEDKSSSSRILEDNFEVLGLGLGLEGRVLGIGLSLEG